MAQRRFFHPGSKSPATSKAERSTSTQNATLDVARKLRRLLFGGRQRHANQRAVGQEFFWAYTRCPGLSGKGTMDHKQGGEGKAKAKWSQLLYYASIEGRQLGQSEVLKPSPPTTQ